MCQPLTPAERSGRRRDEVRAAVLLVADGRFPSVDLVNIPDAEEIAVGLASEADALGVVVDVRTETAGSAPVLVVHRR